jgi:hypothetical protein
MEAYFQRPDAENPAYIEYRLGDYGHEVGIIDKKYRLQAAKEGSGEPNCIGTWMTLKRH